jgi:putative ABC transport system substrate-binding protein
MTSLITRRQFVAGAGVSGAALLAACGRLPWQAQPSRVNRVGMLHEGGIDNPAQARGPAAFQERLRELGYIEGQNLHIEFRSAQFDYSRLPDLATELARLPVDVIVPSGTPSSFAAAKATSSIPIVTVTGDPVRAGLADSYPRPGRNVTGITVLNATLSTKRLELLKEAVPSAVRIAVLRTATNSSMADEFRETQTAAVALGVELISLDSTSAIRRHRDGALAVQ